MHPRTAVLLLTLMLILLVALPLAASAKDEDPYLWLEEVEGEKALEWVKERSAKDTAELEAVPEFAPIHARLLEIYNSRERIPSVSIQGAWLYNFWQDAEHVRGVWRRTFLDQYVTEDPVWETVLDLDALAAAEGENWVWKGADFLQPEARLCLITLSRGGGDAAVVREFDAVAKTFVEDGFSVPEAKSRVGWKDENTLWIGTDFGEGSLTESGYPRLVKEWRRGTPMSEAATVFEGKATDVAVGAYTSVQPEGRYHFVYLTPAFFPGTTYLILDGRLVKLDIPDDADLKGIFKEHLLLSLRTDWETGGRTYPQDALLAIDLDAFLAGDRDFTVLFSPGERVSLDGVRTTRNHLLLSTLDNVSGRLYRLTPAAGEWTREEIELPGLGTVGIGSTSDVDDTFFFTYTDFLTPSSLYLVRPGQQPRAHQDHARVVRRHGHDRRPARGHLGRRHEDPLLHRHAQGLRGRRHEPDHALRLRRLRGLHAARLLGRHRLGLGGEGRRLRAGQHPRRRRVRPALAPGRRCRRSTRTASTTSSPWPRTSSRARSPRPSTWASSAAPTAACWWAAAFVQRPELFDAVVCQVPLLDMKRYNKLLAGASWMSEYGNPDTDDWEFMKTWSPYQNLDKDEDYPKVFFATSTRDDRVHPGPRAQDGQEDERHGQARVLLREHRGRARRGREPEPAGLHVGADLRLPVADAAVGGRGQRTAALPAVRVVQPCSSRAGRSCSPPPASETRKRCPSGVISNLCRLVNGVGKSLTTTLV